MSDKELRFLLGIIIASIFFLGIAFSFRTDEIIRQIKYARGLKDYEHLDLGWRAIVATIGWFGFMISSQLLIFSFVRLFDK